MSSAIYTFKFPPTPLSKGGKELGNTLTRGRGRLRNASIIGNFLKNRPIINSEEI